jgi:hypothetical protein
MVGGSKRGDAGSLTTWNRERKDLKPDSALGTGLPFSFVNMVGSAGSDFLEEKKPIAAYCRGRRKTGKLLCLHIFFGYVIYVSRR